MNQRYLLISGLWIILSTALMPERAESQILNDDLAVGNWVGWAEPEALFQAPFDQVRFQVTFFADGTAYWNDGHEVKLNHGTGHGSWTRTSNTGVLATFVLIGFDATTVTGAGNILKIRFAGDIDPDNPDNITSGPMNLSVFPPGTDPLDPNDTGG